MKKRIRKKHHLGEFQELGFEISFDLGVSDDQAEEEDAFFQFLEHAIEANGLYFGGGGLECREPGLT
jgi:uncharacterized protein YggL (DUF469 family)